MGAALNFKLSWKINSYGFIFLSLFFYTCTKEKGEERSAGNDSIVYSKNYFLSGKIESEGFIRQTKKQGYWKFYSAQGNLLTQGNYRYDLKQDWWEYFDEAGNKVATGHYSNNIKHGYWKFYENNQLRAEGNYNLGVRTGSWKQYNGKGKLIGIHIYE